MARQELIEYIKDNLEKGHSRESITNSLRKHKWPSDDIDAAFDEIRKEKEPEVPEYKKRPEIIGAQATHGHLFGLNDNENIIYETRPLKGYLWYMFASSMIGLLFLFVFLFSWMFVVLAFVPMASVSIIVIIVFIIVVDIIVVRRKYKMKYYWITSQRIIIKRGFIGYSINSIPLERVSDVMISRSFLERVFGFGSLHIQTLAGQYTVRGRLGAEGNLQAIPEPEENQQLIFRLIKKRRKEAHITI